MEEDCGNENAFLKEDAVGWTLISSYHFVFSQLVSFCPKFWQFSVRSLSIKDFVKVNELFNGFFSFLWFTLTFLICCCILTTSQFVFGISILIVHVKSSWLNNIRRVCRFLTPYQWEKDISPFSIAFSTWQQLIPCVVHWIKLIDFYSQTDFLNLFLTCEWVILFLRPSAAALWFISSATFQIYLY